jgi:hypothetical protein
MDPGSARRALTGCGKRLHKRTRGKWSGWERSWWERVVSARCSSGPRRAGVDVPWPDQVPAVVEAWYPGEEDGNPSGKRRVWLQ